MPDNGGRAAGDRHQMLALFDLADARVGLGVRDDTVSSSRICGRDLPLATPVSKTDERVHKIILFATDITRQKSQNDDNEGKIRALSKSAAMI